MLRFQLLVGELGVDSLASSLLVSLSRTIGDLLRGVAVDTVAGLLGEHVEC